MPWIPPEVVKKAKEMDLLTYFMNYRPNELVKVGREYKTKAHGSLRISNGKWMWFSQNIGGRTALDYLINVEGMAFQDAVEEIVGDIERAAPVYVKEPEYVKKELIPPDESRRINEMVYYLRDTRKIDLDIIYDEYNKENLYQTKDYNNVAFVGRNKDGEVRLITLRGTRGDFKNTVAGSDRNYPYKIMSSTKNRGVHIFEAPIDALSYATLMKGRGIDYKQHNFLSLCGVTPPRKDGSGRVPTAIDTYLSEYPYTDMVILHLDNDPAGRNASKVITDVLSARGIKVYDQPPPEGYKDCNDYLKYGEPQLKRMQQKEKNTGREEVTRA